MDIYNIFDTEWIPVGAWVDTALQWVVSEFRFVFQAIKVPFDIVLRALQQTLIGAPDLLVYAIIVGIAWQAGGRKLALLCAAALLGIGLMGAWEPAMTTLSIVLTCVIFCSAVGIPLGIAAAKSERFWTVLRPILDLMQTIPSFVYLVPIVMLFSIGNVSGVIVTCIYALAPVVRLTNLGIRQVRSDMVEASNAFGASKRQTLVKVELPLAMPTIMAGVNQTVMLALSMSVVSSMISVTGLGQMVLRGIGRLDMGLATVGGLGIVFLAIVIDRISQSFGTSARDRGHMKWYETGPVGLVLGLIGRK
ncbi:binding-protein-dependent transport systems inner membrane component (plasmid) [Rhizobium leguminosarum bv. trifolii WSM2304]|uniref:Binding-protein-dependent transport systems inner membrane component n=1 Tax=Rhizobium leguminosarum bv. trifolii (strain WSM2304) TaxID=395492 RepID=A0ABF7QZG0_RHILW|nr:ABC transporter permease subunit [Rhizobium leguminosarum]ACI59530.1 binding-protein-dependent transport systems inner membrane component [Rhizobium leguminosarum bv. trifolii WSM2304]